MTQAEKAELFHNLHVKGDPLVLYNIWDFGSANAVTEAGAKAIATGSWSVAAAQGYADGEQLPLDDLLSTATQIVEGTSLPVSIDFEGGYAREPEPLAENILRLIATGAVGINFEDQIVGSDGLYSIDEQARRIRAIRSAAKSEGITLFINARTDIFLKSKPEDHSSHVSEAVERAVAYEKAGASGFFVPGLTQPELLGQICDAVRLPVNAMSVKGALPIAEQAKLGVSRISYGPGPYRQAMHDLEAKANEIY